MRTKLTVKHEKNCSAVKAVERGDWDSPWFLPIGPSLRYPGRTVRRDKLFRRNGLGERWAEMICNSTTCPARLMVAVNDIEEAAAKESNS